MTRTGMEPRSPGPSVNTLPTKPMMVNSPNFHKRNLIANMTDWLVEFYDVSTLVAYALPNM